MNLEEMLDIIYVLQSNYPSAYSKQSDREAEVMAKSWHMVFMSYDSNLVMQALLSAMLTKPSFPPSIAEVNAKIVEFTNPTIERKKGEEAWVEIYRIMRNSGTYMSEKQQELITAEIEADPYMLNVLRAMGGMEALRNCQLDSMNTFRAQFIRIYEAYANRQYEQLSIPTNIMEKIAEIKNQNMPLASEPFEKIETIEVAERGMPESIKQFLDVYLRGGAVSE